MGGVEDDERLLRDPFDPRRQADRTQSLCHCPVCHANALRIEAAGCHHHDCRIDRLVAATHGQREDERLGSWCIDQRHRHTAGGERIGEGITHIRRQVHGLEITPQLHERRAATGRGRLDHPPGLGVDGRGDHRAAALDDAGLLRGDLADG